MVQEHLHIRLDCNIDDREYSWSHKDESKIQCAAAKRGKLENAPPVFLQSFSENSFLGLKFHTLLSIYTFIKMFDRPIMRPAVAILKKNLKFENLKISRKWLNISLFFLGVE